MSTEVNISSEYFGTTSDGQDIKLFTMTNQNKMTIRVISYGAIVKDILVPDRDGNIADVNLGFDNIEDYEQRNDPYCGAVCGRVTNRIAGAKFTLDGKEYNLAQNDGTNHLHGGVKGFNKVVWNGSINGSKVELTYTSPDGEENYPGEVSVKLTYELTNDNSLILDYTATTNKATPINLTNHCYFNLNGQGSPNIDDHVLTIHADSYTVQDKAFIPSGEIAKVEGTLYDFRKPERLGDRLSSIDDGIGLTINYCVGESGKMKTSARVEHPPSGRVLEVSSTEPGLQSYTSYFLDNVKGKGGAIYKQFSAICLESQHYADSVNHDNFPNVIIRPGETYRQTSIYKFCTVA